MHKDEEKESEKEPKKMGLEEEIERSMLDKRWVYLSKPVDEASAREVIRKIWYLEQTNPGKPILFIISSPGGSVDSGFAIWDQIKMISSPVTTLVTGLAASMGSLLSLVAKKGKRFATANSRL
jgi:ATP-dependent Clp protease protease subunit